jgi:hypothetical protein
LRSFEKAGGRSLRSIVLIAALAGTAVGRQIEFNGQASGWLMLNRATTYQVQAGLRYIPSLSIVLPPYLDAEVSVDAFASSLARSPDSTCTTDARAKPYRAWARLSTARFEARIGLQKINFGSATLLRPLQWFDRVDPRDPLALTDGVYGLLARYYFQNNTNVWVWGLLGNSSPKGWEAIGSERWSPEPGARLQLPVPRGEVAATYHHRAFRSELAYMPPGPRETLSATENRLGIDGKWDIGVGLLFEGVLSRQTSDLRPDFWQRMATVGLDYTLGIGSGLGVTAEHMFAGGADEPFGRGTDAQFSALAVSLPFGLLDNLRAIVYFDWTNRDLYSFLGWQRTTDNWVFSLSVFANPDLPTATTRPGAGVAGKGLRFDVVFNH